MSSCARKRRRVSRGFISAAAGARTSAAATAQSPHSVLRNPLGLYSPQNPCPQLSLIDDGPRRVRPAPIWTEASALSFDELRLPVAQKLQLQDQAGCVESIHVVVVHLAI